MSAKKTTSPEDAQNKERKAEIREREKERQKVIRSFTAEEREMGRKVMLAHKAAVKADRAYQSAFNKFERACEKLSNAKTRKLKSIDRRISILKGRVGAG